MILRHPLSPARRLIAPRLDERPVGLAADRVAAFLLHRNAFRPEEPTGAAVEQEPERDGADGRGRRDH